MKHLLLSFWMLTVALLLSQHMFSCNIPGCHHPESSESQAGASATIKQVRVNWKDTNGGKEGVTFYVDLSIANNKDKRASAVMFFYDENGNNLMTRSNSYSTTNGQLCSSKSFTPPYENTSYTDLEIFIPFAEFAKAGVKNVTLKAKIYIRDNNSNTLTTYTVPNFVFCDFSQDCPCRGTNRCTICGGSGGYYVGYSKMNCVQCYGRCTCQLCDGDGRIIRYSCTTATAGSGYTPVYTSDGGSGSYSSGSSNRVCSGCGGTGECSYCSGRGEYLVDASTYTSSGGYVYKKCIQCNGNKRCKVCNGRKR